MAGTLGHVTRSDNNDLLISSASCSADRYQACLVVFRIIN